MELVTGLVICVDYANLPWVVGIVAKSIDDSPNQSAKFLSLIDSVTPEIRRSVTVRRLRPKAPSSSIGPSLLLPPPSVSEGLVPSRNQVPRVSSVEVVPRWATKSVEVLVRGCNGRVTYQSHEARFFFKSA